MSFPHRDKYWQEVADFVLARAGADDAILAPEPFWRLFPRIYRYINTRLKPEQVYHWAIMHKGELSQIDRSVLPSLATSMKPVMANEVFVVWAGDRSLPSIDPQSSHLVSYFEIIASLPPEAPLALDQEPVLPDVGQIVQLPSLDDQAFVRAMDDFWANGGYKFDTLRDKTYYNELDRAVVEIVGSAQSLSVLDLCCGDGRFQEILSAAASVVGVDISKFAVGLAQKRHINTPTFTFETMDAHTLRFANASFDLVLFMEAIEHVRDVSRVLAEATRVLKPGGRLIVSTANSNSLHQIIARKLGYRSYLTSFQHFKEYTVAEVGSLMEAAGMTVIGSRGIFLYPYWGIPGMDELARPFTDWDSEVVELFRVLGERAGPEYSYSFVIIGQKHA